MKKIIKQWCVGLAIALLGSGICLTGSDAVFSFIDMVNTTGSECVGYFIRFIFMLSLFTIFPYVFFMEIKDGVKYKFK